MAKIQFKNFNQVSDRIEKKLLAQLKESLGNNIADYAQLVTADIRAQTRSGKDLVNDRKQPPLARSTIESREYLEKYTDTHPLYSRRRSNLTVTGQLLDAIIYKIKKSFGGSKYEIEIEVANTVRKTYQPKDSTASIKRLTNKKLQEYLKDKGREFLGIRKQMIERIRRLALQDLRRNIRKVLARK